MPLSRNSAGHTTHEADKDVLQCSALLTCLALHPIDMLIGHHVPIGTSMATNLWCGNSDISQIPQSSAMVGEAMREDQ